MNRKRQKLRISRVRRHSNYTVQDVCDLLRVHKNTVREWLRSGLPKIDNQRPLLIHGHDLKAFLTARQQLRKKECALNELFCCRCKCPRRPMGNLADIAYRNATTVMLSGICEACGITLHKIQSVRRIADLVATFDIPTLQQSRLRASLQTSVECDLERSSLT